MDEMQRYKWEWDPNQTKNEWGPIAWRWLHLQCINFPLTPKPADRDNFLKKIWAFITQLPCLECRMHATKYLVNTPPDTSSRYTLDSWAFTFHNVVNARLHKKIFTRDDYDSFYAEDIRLAMRY
jgi:hypothetical protein